jgi:hypothetical protein
MGRSNFSSTRLKVEIMGIINIEIDPANKVPAGQGVDDSGKPAVVRPMPPTTPPTFQHLTNLYEPSAIQQLPDGRFLVVEDEKNHSFSLLTLSANGDVSSKSLGPAWFHGGDPIWKLDDRKG